MLIHLIYYPPVVYHFSSFGFDFADPNPFGTIQSAEGEWVSK